VSTNALELGIDIGALDVAVMAGYPGTIAATWQRAGRAGRRASRSAAVMVASSAPLDQFVVRNPSYFFDASPERALIDPDNLHILVDHIKCAAFELPFASTEEFGRHNVQEILGVLAEQGLVFRQPTSEAQSLRSRPRDSEAHDASGGGAPRETEKWTWTSESYPADAVSLRSVSSDNFVIVDQTNDAKVIGETDFTSGPATLHPKAIYIVEAKLYQVERLDFDGRKAFVREVDCDYYTSAITYTRVTPIDTFESACGYASDREREARSGREASASGGGAPREVRESWPTRAHGEVHVVSRVVGFKKIKFYTNENVGSGELDLPEQQMHTTSYWMTIPAAVMSVLPYAADDRRDGVVGLAFAIRQVAQLLLMCDGHDVGISINSGERDERLEAGADKAQTIFVYDNYPGGIGFSKPLFELHAELLENTRRLIAECQCESGCPGCVGPVGNTGPLAKAAALRILDLLLSNALSAGAAEVQSV
jgi:DEAD/DEAH box helicase domain-containing protein